MNAEKVQIEYISKNKKLLIVIPRFNLQFMLIISHHHQK